MNKMNKKGKIIGLSLAAIMVVSLFAVAIPLVAAPAGDKPDLVITDIWVEGNRIHYTIENIGGAEAPTSYTGLYINDIYRARDRVDPLPRGSGEREEVFAGYNYRDGDIEVCADYQNRIDELDEENNCRGGLPDLVIIDKEEIVDPETCKFTVHFKVCNEGESDAGPSTACVHINGNDFVEGVVGNGPGEVPVPPLAADACSEELTSGPWDCTPCETVVVTVEADNYDEVDECDEENNVLENEFHCPGPDLVITDKEEIFDPVTCTYRVIFTVNNIGFCDAGPSVACVYIDGVWQDVDVNVGPLAAGKCSDPIEVGPFECTPCEFVRVAVKADNYHDVEECNDENNVLENEFHCPGPDLVITYKLERVNPLTCKFKVIFTVNNIGICDAGASTACVYINGVQVGDADVGPLAAGECSGRKKVGPFDCTPCEILTIKVEADNDNDVAECDEENNVLENEFHCPGPDLIILDKYETVNPEDCTFTVTFVVANFGICIAGRSTACVYVDGAQVNVPIPILVPFQWTPKITVGPFDCTPCETVTVIVEADNDDDVVECDEENNCMTNIVICPCVLPLPDLVIRKIWVDDNRIHYTIENIGGADAPTSYSSLCIDGIYRARDRVDPLPVGLGRDEMFARYNYEGGEIEVCADYQDRIEEIDEDNNCLILEEGNND
jgi:subtilase family serine protease